MDYDTVIIGAGPGGSMTAKTAAELGLDVLLVEKRPEIGMPVRCGEGTGIKGLKELGIPKNKKYIAWETKGEYIYSPDGKRLEIVEDEPNGYVLERRMFDKYLALYAAKAGADIRTRTYAMGIKRENGFLRIKLKHFNEVYEVSCKIVVGADGIEGTVGKWTGLENRTKLSQMTSNVQYEMVGLKLENPEVMEFYLGRKIAPGGYAWVFPKGEDIANVGLGIRPTGKDTAFEYLNRFISSHDYLKKGKKVGMVVGGVPVQGPITKSVTDNVLLVGDAARHVDPLTGGGMYNAMVCGRIAAKVIREAVDTQNFSEEFLMKYENEWREKVGAGLMRSLKVKEVLEKLSDEQMNQIGKFLRGMKIGKLDIKEVSTSLLKLPPEFIKFVESLL
jgi:digeranylgeranylglycerophospholipid reductase